MGAGVPALICYFLLEVTIFNYGLAGNSVVYVSRWRVHTYRLSKPILGQRLVCVLGDRRDFVLEALRGENPTSPPPIIWKDLLLLYNSIDKLLVFIIILLLLAYLFARVYLVVESFIQIFHLEPGSAFEQPHWSSYIPHLG
jgi:hypothetical protein